MKTFIIFLFSCLCLIFEVSALDWPVITPIVHFTFGSWMGDYPLPGILVRSGQSPVSVPDSGFLAYKRDEFSQTALLPAVMGSYTVLRSISGFDILMSGYLPAKIIGLDTGKLEKQTLLGKNDPDSALFLGVFDRKRGQWINPLLLLPGKPSGLRIPVPSMILLNERGEWKFDRQGSVAQGSYTFLIDLSSPIQPPGDTSARIQERLNSAKMQVGAPSSIQILMDGKVLGTLPFDMLWWRGGRRTLVPPEVSVRPRLYDGKGRLVLTELFLPRGETSIGIIITDIAGIQRKTEWSVKIR